MKLANIFPNTSLNDISSETYIENIPYISSNDILNKDIDFNLLQNIPPNDPILPYLYIEPDNKTNKKYYKNDFTFDSEKETKLKTKHHRKMINTLVSKKERRNRINKYSQIIMT